MSQYIVTIYLVVNFLSTPTQQCELRPSGCQPAISAFTVNHFLAPVMPVSQNTAFSVLICLFYFYNFFRKFLFSPFHIRSRNL